MHHDAQRGLSLLEFSFVATVLSLIAGSLLTTLFYYEELAEAAVMQLTVQNMRSGLRYQIANRLVSGRTSEMGQLLTQNPVEWIEKPPDGYVGGIRTTDIESMSKGSWFYEVDRGELGYVPRHSFYLQLESGGPAVLRWRVQALRIQSPREVEGVTLVSVTPYRWF
jgi:hypothetical protein